MSKYLAIIDLPDDSKCDRCTFADEYCCRHIGHWFRRGNTTRPTDCTLIPVDRVMDRLYGLCQSQGDAGYRAVGILQDELGVME